MKAFQTISVPHKNIVEGNLTMNMFAVDLWDVFKERGSAFYADQVLFSRHSYQTGTLTTLYENLEKRLHQQRGDPLIRLQAPAGGGKTHALIALYHRAKEWKIKPVVFVGTACRASDTLWGVLEEQLTGRQERFVGHIAPGRELLRDLLSNQPPVLILIDEILQYVTKAATIQIGESTLAAQTLAFLQELVEVMNELTHVALVVTLPTGSLGRYDETAAWFFGQFQKILGRMEKIYTPIQQHEVVHIIRQQLFASLDLDALNELLDDFLDNDHQASLLPAGIQSPVYRKRFETSYPFLPEMLDVLFRRWGSFSDFQHVRGLLRLLSLIVSSCQTQALPYVSLANVNLADQHIRHELLRYVGLKFDDVILTDILAEHAGAKIVDAMLEQDGEGEGIGTRVAQTIFLYSFSENSEPGASVGAIRRHASSFNITASAVDRALEQLNTTLHYLHDHQHTYLFRSELNLNRMLLTKMEYIEDHALEELEKELLKKCFPGEGLEVLYWVDNHSDIPDNPSLKLVIMKTRDEEFMRQALAFKGKTPRVNKNTLFFLTPLDSTPDKYRDLLRQLLGWGMLLADSSQHLSDEQRKSIKGHWKNVELALSEAIQTYYRVLLVPEAGALKECDIGTASQERQQPLDKTVYARLVSDGAIVEHVDPLLFKERYLREKPFTFTDYLFRWSTTTLGAVRVAGRHVCENAIKDGVKKGIFGLGVLQGKKLVCHAFQEDVWQVDFSDDEIIIREDLCVVSPAAHEELSLSDTSLLDAENVSTSPISPIPRSSVQLRFDVPQGNIAGLMSVIYSLRNSFTSLTLDITAENGMMTDHAYKVQIQETLQDLGIECGE